MTASRIQNKNTYIFSCTPQEVLSVHDLYKSGHLLDFGYSESGHSLVVVETSRFLEYLSQSSFHSFILCFWVEIFIVMTALLTLNTGSTKVVAITVCWDQWMCLIPLCIWNQSDDFLLKHTSWILGFCPYTMYMIRTWFNVHWIWRLTIMFEKLAFHLWTNLRLRHYSQISHQILSMFVRFCSL